MILILSFLFTSGTLVLYRVIIRDYSTKSKKRPEIDNNSLAKLCKNNLNNKKDERILIVGAGETGRTILTEYCKKGMRKNVIGFVDDNEHKIGNFIIGKKIFNSIININYVIEQNFINKVIIAMPSADSSVINRVVTLIRIGNPNFPIKITPHFIDIFENRPLIPTLQEVGIVDLIGREEFIIDIKAIEEKFSGKTILVTGAGGSIGSEICRQMLKFNIKRLIALGRGEFSIYNLMKKLTDHMKFLDYESEIIYKIVDVKDYRLLDLIFEEYNPEVIFHAAAHKHVPLMEFNEIEAIQNNVIGTKNLLDLCVKYLTKEVVLISTDKAVHPINIMGATKRIAELITLYYYREMGLKTSIVRFGNVIGSRGSVIPLFCEQIENGGPITITHPEMKRFFMSILEATLLVINAAAYSKGGEIFVLNMGEQYKIVDVAYNLIKLYGYEPEKDIKIVYTGLKPYEKLHEELFYKRDNLKNTDNEKIFIYNSDEESIQKEIMEIFLHDKMESYIDYDSSQIRKLIKRIIPEYNEITHKDEKKVNYSSIINN